MIQLDGSLGEGGGQILRTALALSALTGQAFTLDKIRAGRPKPGLMRQHLACVETAAALCGAKTDGAELRSSRLVFQPGKLVGGTHRCAIGSAGSVTLVAQTILPILSSLPEAADITIEGGTHVPFAPVSHFTDRTLLPLLRQLGVKVEATWPALGFMPAGGGSLRLVSQPSKWRQPRGWERAGTSERLLFVLHQGLEADIVKRSIGALREAFGEDASEVLTIVAPAPSPGLCLMVEERFANHSQLFTALGQKNVPVKDVVDDVVKPWRRWRETQTFACPYLADQLLLPLAIAGGGEFTALGWTPHAQTQADLIPLFLPRRIKADRQADRTWKVVVS